MLRVVSPLSDREEQVFSRAMDCAFAVHRELGPGYREKIYDVAYCLELDAKGITFEREKKVDVRYKQWVIPGQRVDLVLEGLVLVEIKAASKLLKLTVACLGGRRLLNRAIAFTMRLQFEHEPGM